MRLLAATLLILSAAHAQPPAPAHGQRPQRLIVRNAMVVEGVGTPASGPRDIVIEGGKIVRIVPSRAKSPAEGVEIDAAGKYVLPGFINMHGHVHDERAGKPMDVNYCLKLWLAAGITTSRDVGSNFEKSKALRERSAKGEIAAPRLVLYPFFGAPNPDAARKRVQEFHANGAEGLKFLGTYRDVMEAGYEEAKKLGLRIAHHTGVEETNAWDDIRFGTTTIEHWYGIPDAALENGVQGFPPSYNYQNELDRFRYAGRLWREANPERLAKVLQGMVDAKVGWDPTLSIYVASRDLQRAQTAPWFKEYLHPSLEAFFQPNLENHGSYFTEWTSTDEVFWKENYRIWMAALRDFERRGGLVTTGEDAGYIWQVYGFGYLQELELHQEAGFPTLKVIQHATHNGARALGKENEIGRVRTGWNADLIVVNGNPVDDLRVLYPRGVLPGRKNGIEWTIKDGIPYHVPVLLEEIRGIVTKARAARPNAQ
ncbi:MAG: amidohydrolase family protein [Bryobacteraceae bacterium]|nr:amidohydrolase family protein [Bryobacteraceae bacterium]